MPSKPAKSAPPPKASERLVARMSEELKTQLVAAIADHPHYRGNLSEWVNACAQAYVLQTRRGEAPAFPVEFIPASK